METGSPRKIQFTMPLLDSHLDPEAAEQIRRRRPTPATLVASSDQSSPELQFMVEHHLYKQQHGGDDECSSESCLSDRPSPDTLPTGEELELPEDEEAWGTGDNVTAEAFEKLRCQMEGRVRDGG
ncbi:protein phosphatase 1 regulatory subunit 1A-like [Salvelinus namaycush]|uniref:Protein phosphatase 1 regulatory subunit 1A n=1 Tax=Salvelinus namaycush TaxID=8040 RepID=A0A8U1F7N5_SALNM|nr:protein phosphatase 1 regulatory subunit 1A-like [Salvelinus namaycush]